MKIFSDENYIEYMRAYDEFYKKRRSILKLRGCPKLDSQFSENLAASKVGFHVDHSKDLDGCDANGETYEVKGTGYGNTKVHFSDKQADHVIWVKATPSIVYIYEVDKSVYDARDSRGFVDLKKIPNTLKSELDFKEKSAEGNNKKNGKNDTGGVVASSKKSG